MAVNIDTQRESVMPTLEAFTGSKSGAALLFDILKEMQGVHDEAEEEKEDSNG